MAGAQSRPAAGSRPRPGSSAGEVKSSSSSSSSSPSSSVTAMIGHQQIGLVDTPSTPLLSSSTSTSLILRRRRSPESSFICVSTKMMLVAAASLLLFLCAVAVADPEPQLGRVTEEQEPADDKGRVAFYAKRLVKCQQSQGGWSKGDGTEMASCLKDIVLSVAPRLRDSRGLPELELPRIDPFDLQQVAIDGDRGLKANMTDLRLYGITSGLTPENLNIKVNPKNLRADLFITIPNLRLEGDFDMSIDFAKTLFPFLQGFREAKSSGRLTAEFEKVDARGLGIFKEATTGTARLGVFLQRVGVDFDFHEGKYSIQSKDPSDPIIPILQAILNDQTSSKAIVREIKPEIIQVINKLLYQLMSRGVQNLDKLL